ncbi:MAG: sigma-70 family RNA polymerase sigma factor [Gemmataceae bacterium]
MPLDRQAVVQALLRGRLRLLASAMPILRDAHLAEDVFQQVVLKALETTESFREVEHVLAWGIRTARHRAIDLARSRRLLYFNDEVLQLLEESMSVASTELQTRSETLQKCLEKLPDRSQELLKLRYEEGLRCHALAERIRRTVDAVYQSLSRIHRQLRDCVEEQLGQGGAASSGVVT